MKHKKYFTETLLEWNRDSNTRTMPWKHEKDPYRIWISEIILQQTRVQQGLEYYKRFISKFPNVKALAEAEENEVFKLWEGLGYYTRCKNIIESAKFIHKELNDKFPATFEDILKLKGIGNYTASAIASFAYNLPYAVVDGNVFRVFSRFFGIRTPIDISEGKNIFTSLANKLLDEKNPAIYNQAIMDFGAVVCKPQPLCNVCPLQLHCVAYQNDLISELPVKQKSIIRKNRWFYYFVIEKDDKFYVRKRIEKDIWQNLYEFVLIESQKPVTIKKLKLTDQFQLILKTPYTINNVSEIYKQQLTHQIINSQFIHISVIQALDLQGYELVSTNRCMHLPFPKIISSYLKDKLVSLNLSS